MSFYENNQKIEFVNGNISIKIYKHDVQRTQFAFQTSFVH